MKRVALQVFAVLGVLPGVAFVVLPRLVDEPPSSLYDSRELIHAPSPSDRGNSLREAFIAFLASDKSLAGAETAAYLRKRDVRIEMRLFDEPAVMAEYDSEHRLISLSPTRSASRYLSAARAAESSVSLSELKSMQATWEADPRILKEFVRRSSWLIVHEAHHAAYTDTLGTDWNSAEQESACRSYEILFMIARLDEDPSFLDMADYDRQMRFFLAGGFDGPLSTGSTFLGDTLPNGVEEWWRKPLPDGTTLAQVEEAGRRLRDLHPGRFEDLVYHWYLIHQMAVDPGMYWETLDTLLPRNYDRAGQDPERHMRALRAQIADLQQQLVTTGGAENRKIGDRVAALNQHLASDTAFYADPAKVKEYRDFFRKERVRLGAELARLVAPN